MLFLYKCIYSYFTAVAGNIIPAIATANAIIAGYVVLQTLKILENRVEKCQSVYLRRLPNPRGQLVVPEKSLSVPNPKCTVCSNKPQVRMCRTDTFILYEGFTFSSRKV